MKLKKLLSMLCVTGMVFSVGSAVVSADEVSKPQPTVQEGDTILINNDSSAFSEIVFFKDGKAYLPLRLVFPNFNDRVNKLGCKIAWDTNNYGLVHLIYGKTTGEGFIVEANRTTTFPFTGTRKCVDIFLSGDGETGMTADLSVIDYAILADGRRVTSGVDDTQILSDKLYLKPVEGGDRLFASVDDIVKLSNLLGIDDAYQVKLHEIIYQ